MKKRLLWSVVLLCFAVTAFAHHTPEHERAANRARALAMVTRLGGTITGGTDGQPVTKIDLHKSAVTDADVALLASVSELEELDLRLTSVTDAGIAPLHDLTKLRFLNLFRTPITDAGVASLAPLHELETLLIGTKVTDAGLAAVAAHPKLRKLSLFDTQVTDAGLKQLEGLSGLRVLLVGNSSVTPEGTARLQTVLPQVSFKEE
jgi:hypothetical protein